VRNSLHAARCGLAAGGRQASAAAGGVGETLRCDALLALTGRQPQQLRSYMRALLAAGAEGLRPGQVLPSTVLFCLEAGY
jgi:hypothetical protein